MRFLVDAAVAQGVLVEPPLVEPALVEDQDERQRREDRERPERAPELRGHVAGEPEEQRHRERLYYYRGVHHHRRRAPEPWTREPLPHPLQEEPHDGLLHSSKPPG